MLIKLINLSKSFNNIYKSLLSFIYSFKPIFICKIFSLFIINSNISILSLLIDLSYIKFINDSLFDFFMIFFDEVVPRTYSCGSRGFRRGPDDGHNHRQGATSSTSRVISLQGQSGARTAWAIPGSTYKAETFG